MPASNAQAQAATIAATCLAKAIQALVRGEPDIADMYAKWAEKSAGGYTYGYFYGDCQNAEAYVRQKRELNNAVPKTEVHPSVGLA